VTPDPGGPSSGHPESPDAPGDFKPANEVTPDSDGHVQPDTQSRDAPVISKPANEVTPRLGISPRSPAAAPPASACEPLPHIHRRDLAQQGRTIAATAIYPGLWSMTHGFARRLT